jgi:hypothetical protein
MPARAHLDAHALNKSTCFFAAIGTSAYAEYRCARTTGRATFLINGRDSGGAGADRDLAEPLEEMEKAVGTTTA